MIEFTKPIFSEFSSELWIISLSCWGGRGGSWVPGELVKICHQLHLPLPYLDTSITIIIQAQPQPFFWTTCTDENIFSHKTLLWGTLIKICKITLNLVLLETWGLQNIKYDISVAIPFNSKMKEFTKVTCPRSERSLVHVRPIFLKSIFCFEIMVDLKLPTGRALISIVNNGRVQCLIWGNRLLLAPSGALVFIMV